MLSSCSRQGGVSILQQRQMQLGRLQAKGGCKLWMNTQSPTHSSWLQRHHRMSRHHHGINNGHRNILRHRPPSASLWSLSSSSKRCLPKSRPIRQQQGRPPRTTRRSLTDNTTTTTTSPTPPPTEFVPEPDFKTLRLIVITQSIPFIGFGICDNAILIIAGDAIDTSLGVMFGISTLCAAAIGNIISDVAGIMLGTVIEDFCANVLRLPVPQLTMAQRQLRSVRLAYQLGCGFGMVTGCIIGMFPLWFIDSKKIQMMKKDAHVEAIYRDVVTEAKTLIGAESTCLYLRVSKKSEKDLDGSKKGINKHSKLPYQPDAEGDYLYAMYYVLPTMDDTTTMAKSTSTTKTSPTANAATDPAKETATATAAASSGGRRQLSLKKKQETSTEDRLLPLGRGIISRAVLTGEPWNIYDVHTEPDFIPDGSGTVGRQLPSHLKHMVVVPVLDAQGRAIAVIQAMNKSTKGSADQADDTSYDVLDGFTDQDVQILMALASHVSVSLQSIFQNSEEEEELRLRDTIQTLKQNGLSGIEKTKGTSRLRKLFPED